MSETHLHTCMLCEAMCGLVVEVEDGRVVRVRGDEADPHGKGHICPKATAISDICLDPDRVRTPLRRTDSGFEPIGWDEALALAGERLGALQRKHGAGAVGLYLGNPTAHSPGGAFGAAGLITALGTPARFSANSIDGLPHLLSSFLVLGNQAMLPVPDIDRTRFFLIFGANPVVSNGSLMSAPDAAGRIRAIRERGGRVVVVDPRRSETAALADTYLPIRPSRDVFLLLALIHEVFATGKARPGRLAPLITGFDALKSAVARFPPDAVAVATGIAAEDIRALARDFCAAEGAVAYGRMGVCTQEHGALSAWLVLALNVVTGNLDREGGAMFPKGPVDLAATAARIGQRGSFDTSRSRVRGLPEVGGELPIAVLAEEMETPGKGQIRGLITVAGNPVLSAPNGRRIERALGGLEFMVSVDLYVNETTRHADLILPTSFGYERDHHDVALHSLAVRNGARYVRGFLPAPPGTREDFQVMVRLGAAVARKRGGLRGLAMGLALRAFARLGTRRVVDFTLRTGPYGLSVKRLLANPHGLDLGPLMPRLPGKLGHKGGRIELAPAPFLVALDALKLPDTAADGLVLIGRRLLRSNNSWMHNSRRLTKGRPECTLQMHPEDAAARGVKDHAQVRLRGGAGEITALVELTDEVSRGVVSLPHGFGHGRAGSTLSVASEVPGENVNDVIEDTRVDLISGTAAFSGTPVEVFAT